MSKPTQSVEVPHPDEGFSLGGTVTVERHTTVANQGTRFHVLDDARVLERAAGDDWGNVYLRRWAKALSNEVRAIGQHYLHRTPREERPDRFEFNGADAALVVAAYEHDRHGQNAEEYPSVEKAVLGRIAAYRYALKRRYPDAATLEREVFAELCGYDPADAHDRAVSLDVIHDNGRAVTLSDLQADV